jgi:hypothetical protein
MGKLSFCRNPLWRKCEVATHTPENGTWESFRILENSECDCNGQNTSHWSILYILERSWNVYIQNGLAEPFVHLQHKLWSKEGPGVKLAVWLPTTKSQESTRSQCVQVKCDTLLESSQGELQLWFRPCPDPNSGREVMNAINPGSPNWDNFGTPLWESREKKPFGCKCGGELQRILYGGRWWLPPSPGRGESSESKVARGLS